MDTMRLTVLAMALLGSAGCGAAFGSHKMMDTADLVSPLKMKSVTEVQVFHGEALPKMSCVATASLEVRGNGLATEDDLIEALRLEAFRVRANTLIVDSKIETTSMMVSTYGGGIGLSSNVTYPHMRGVACRTGSIWHGVRFTMHAARWVVRYVYDGSPGHKAGIKEGDEVVTVSGVFLGDDPSAWGRYVSAGKRHAEVAIGLLRAGDKQQVVMTLEQP